LPATLLKKGLTENPVKHLSRRDQPAQRLQINGCSATLLKKGLSINLFKKGLIKNTATFEFESRIPKPYRREHNPF